jgi:hypothetical protein
MKGERMLSNDPFVSMAELEFEHLKHWPIATEEQFLEYCKNNPRYKGEMSCTVRDNIGHCRHFLSAHGEEGWKKYLKAVSTEDTSRYWRLIREYVRRFKTDTPRPRKLSKDD